MEIILEKEWCEYLPGRIVSVSEARAAVLVKGKIAKYKDPKTIKVEPVKTTPKKKKSKKANEE